VTIYFRDKKNWHIYTLKNAIYLEGNELSSPKVVGFKVSPPEGGGVGVGFGVGVGLGLGLVLS
jgi:hypothetical protein